jgi:hypothetical protein
MGRRNPLTVEHLSSDFIDVNHLKRLGLLTDKCMTLPGGLRWPSLRRIISERYWLILDLGRHELVQNVRVSWTRCNFGGWRPWMICPYCEKRVAKLLMGPSRYMCRACIGDPLYACQTKSTYGRKHFSLSKIRLQLNGMASPTEPFPERPRGMRRTRYERMRARALRLEEDLPVKHLKKAVDYRNLAYYVP